MSPCCDVDFHERHHRKHVDTHIELVISMTSEDVLCEVDVAFDLSSAQSC